MKGERCVRGDKWDELFEAWGRHVVVTNNAPESGLWELFSALAMPEDYTVHDSLDGVIEYLENETKLHREGYYDS